MGDCRVRGRAESDAPYSGEDARRDCVCGGESGEGGVAAAKLGVCDAVFEVRGRRLLAVDSALPPTLRVAKIVVKVLK